MVPKIIASLLMIFPKKIQKIFNIIRRQKNPKNTVFLSEERLGKTLTPIVIEDVGSVSTLFGESLRDPERRAKLYTLQQQPAPRRHPGQFYGTHIC